MTRCLFFQPGLLSALLLCGGVMLLSPAALAAPSWLKNYRERMQQQWNKPAGEGFSKSYRSRIWYQRVSSSGRFTGEQMNRISGLMDQPFAALSASDRELMLRAMLVESVEVRKRIQQRLDQQRQALAQHQAQHFNFMKRWKARAQGWTERYLSPWAVSGGFGATVRRATADIHTRWEARLRLVHKPQPRLPLQRSRPHDQRR